MTDFTTFLAAYCLLSRGTNSIFVTMRTRFPELPPGITTRRAGGDDGEVLLHQSHHEDLPVLIGGNIGSAAYRKHR